MSISPATLTGRTPRWVKTTTTRVPGQYAMDPMIYSILCEYEPADLMSTLHFNNIAPALHHSPYLWHIDGTNASASIARYGPLRDGRTELTISFKEGSRSAAGILYPRQLVS